MTIRSARRRREEGANTNVLMLNYGLWEEKRESGDLSVQGLSCDLPSNNLCHHSGNPVLVDLEETGLMT